MKKLFGTITINTHILEQTDNTHENINYYKLKNKKYGLSITRLNGNNRKKNAINIFNLTDNESAINYILNMLINKQIRPEQSDVIDDLVKQYL